MKGSPIRCWTLGPPIQSWAILCAIFQVVESQTIRTATVNNEPDRLIAAIADTSTGIEITQATLMGTDCAGTFNGGNFVGKGIDIGFPTTGIVLSTGKFQSIEGPDNFSPAITDERNQPGDADLEALKPGFETFDACGLAFEFTCPGDGPEDFMFQYIFGSEEYTEFVATEFNDNFAFFLNGVNIATLANGVAVEINTVNQITNTEFFRNNDIFDSIDPLPDGTSPFSIEADGFTTTLTASGTALPGMNTMKMVVADLGDAQFDSWVLIPTFSFQCDTTPFPTQAPVLTDTPTQAPTQATSPTGDPTPAPPQEGPTAVPTQAFTQVPTAALTQAPTQAPTVALVQSRAPTVPPTRPPTITPTAAPTLIVAPTAPEEDEIIVCPPVGKRGKKGKERIDSGDGVGDDIKTGKKGGSGDFDGGSGDYGYSKSGSSKSGSSYSYSSYSASSKSGKKGGKRGKAGETSGKKSAAYKASQRKLRDGGMEETEIPIECIIPGGGGSSNKSGSSRKSGKAGIKKVSKRRRLQPVAVQAPSAQHVV